MITKKDVDILTNVNDSYFDSNNIFGADQGLNLAVAFVNPSDPLDTLDKSIGRLYLSYSEWGYSQENSEYFDASGLLKVHSCS